MDSTIAERAGYRSDFLAVPVALPAPSAGTPVRELSYTHFTVLLDPVRRLALSTGVNIDGGSLYDLERGDDWHLDARVPESEQTGESVYARNDLDRGHLVRRRDPVWGDRATAMQANFDTFAYPNAAPQANDFNQSKELWLGLEDHVLSYAQANRNRISVFTSPVLALNDPLYRGVGIPQAFWKVAVWTSAATGTSALRSAGFVLDQSSQLTDIDLDDSSAQALIDGGPPPLGPYLSYQVPVEDIESLTGLDFGDLVGADVMGPVLAGRADGSPRTGWVRLRSEDDISLEKAA
ncbi:DNA/RNA non-specific endonuclease [Agreia pratensis]|uniref:Endonuclease G n=1 Tax=Agreia pratensis TaxID=150121 RepID=A0A1X7KLG2_9MICO|nr:DNA/RNA non-specific endonuclease [Agreia pratensis]SMG41528.1 endonuclease G [Agreia pratensis]